jgi:5-methylthioadenosine/S-adenosylhomocysteine deaminase
MLSCLLALALTASASAQDLALKLTVVTPAQVVESALVTVKGGRIDAVAPNGTASNAIAVDGVMFPGLIDLHNHMTWNVLPNWQPPHLYTNRYEWAEAPEYAVALAGPNAAMTAAGASCDMNRFGEVKSIVNGGTVTVGSYGPSNAAPDRNRCILGLARNADFAADLTSPATLNGERYRNFVFPFQLNAEEENLLRTVDPNSTDPHVMRAASVHLAEGTDGAARREFAQFMAHKYARPGVNVIHAVALAPEQIRELAREHVGLIWSPHSNFILYGKTADIQTALDAKMTVALAPDWSPSGSAGMLEEIGVAYKYSLTLSTRIAEKALVDMATINPAKMAGMDAQLGSIEPGKLADLVVMKRKGATAYQALLLASPGDVLLVAVGGVPVYGDRALMHQLLPRAPLEEIIVCGEAKSLHIVDDRASDQSWTNVHQRLADLMKRMGLAPAPLATCGTAPTP